MLHPRQHITDLAAICKKRNIRHIVISPGSRSAPLIKSFYDAFGENCISIVDERSAAYFALGISIHQHTPAVLICTSGTAVLNYAPALAEAYYQQVPLLAITADRPHEWIDQHDNQTLRQKNIYNNFIRGGFELPQYIATDEDLWFAHRMINDALNICTGDNPGPVHINVPLTEPLYEILPPVSVDIRLAGRVKSAVSVKLPDELIHEWSNARKIMIIHGQDSPGAEMSKSLKPLLADPRVIAIAENISNIQEENIISNSNLILSISRGRNPEYPDLVLHSGGQVVSKALAGYLRRAPKIHCWRIGPDDRLIDTFKLATRYIPYHPKDVYKALQKSTITDSKYGYRKSWITLCEEGLILAENRMASIPFTDLQVFKRILALIPEGSDVILGNSSVIRYSQVFPARKKINYYSNRGVSGIDGCLSTAAGIAYASKNMTIAIVGDLGFLYDSNALWNRDLPLNLRIVVINNQGGGIFHIIKGPSEHPGFKKFIEANHPVNIAKLAEAYGLRYLSATDDKGLIGHWPGFSVKDKGPAIFEIRTNPRSSAMSFRDLMAGHS
jgi:2-succinyl-5-enolpyruvyl-6-hydroxy-3-cyclohexene-1-carboxylate synthase